MPSRWDPTLIGGARTERFPLGKSVQVVTAGGEALRFPFSSVVLRKAANAPKMGGGILLSFAAACHESARGSEMADCGMVG